MLVGVEMSEPALPESGGTNAQVFDLALHC